jgi:hypothetical protein
MQRQQQGREGSQARGSTCHQRVSEIAGVSNNEMMALMNTRTNGFTYASASLSLASTFWDELQNKSDTAAWRQTHPLG